MRFMPTVLPALLFVSLMPHPILAQEAGELQPELGLFRPFLGEWVGEFQNSEEGARVLRNWTSAMDGQAVREVRSVPELGFEAETLFFLDSGAAAVCFLALTNNGYVIRGEVALEGENLVQTGTQLHPDRTMSRFRVSFTLQGDGTFLDRFFTLVDGDWRPGHVVHYARASGFF